MRIHRSKLFAPFLLPLLAANAVRAETAPAGPAIVSAYCGSLGASCRLGDSLTVKMSGLDPFADASHFVLALDGRVVPGLPAWRSGDELKFSLVRLTGDAPTDADNRAAWKDIVKRARQDPSFRVGAGPAGKISDAGDPTIKLTIFPSYAWISIVFLPLLFVVFVGLAIKSNILRDPGPTPPAGRRLCYSLARTQMAWWLFIVLGAYHYIGLATGDWESLSPSILVLIGISAATGLGAVMIDGGKRDQRAALEGQQNALNAEIAALQARTSAVPAPPDLSDSQNQVTRKQNDLAGIQASLKGLPGGAEWTSEGFFRDILRDDTGVSFHRFQIAAWMGVLGFVFAISVIRDFVMPEFSSTLLGLMGISSGTYIGFKIPDPPK